MDFNEAMRSIEGDDGPSKTADEHIGRQFIASQWHLVNLSLTWRELGCPEDKEPATWSLIAMPFIQGVASYMSRIDKLTKRSREIARDGRLDDHLVLVNNLNENTPATWQPYDVLGSYFVAVAYARFFDCDTAYQGDNA